MIFLKFLTQEQKETILHRFNSFSKRGLRWALFNYRKHLNYLLQHEASFSELSEEQLAQLFTTDEYPSDVFHFSVQGYAVSVHDELLAKALAALPPQKRDIILLSYFLDMTDQKIAEQLNTPRSTVQRKRANTLKELKTTLEGFYDDETAK